MQNTTTNTRISSVEITRLLHWSEACNEASSALWDKLLHEELTDPQYAAVESASTRLSKTSFKSQVLAESAMDLNSLLGEA